VFILEQVVPIYIFRGCHITIFVSRELVITSMAVVREIFPRSLYNIMVVCGLPIMPDNQDNFQSLPVQPPFDIELLQREVGQRFPFYDMRSNVNAVAFFCRIDEETFEEKFESLRLSLLEKGYIPMIRLEHGEHIIYVVQKPPRKKTRSKWINVVLLAATVCTTTLVGSLQWVSIRGVTWETIFSPGFLLDGFIFFSVPLLLILGVHEMGHYLVSKRHHVDSSLPYFIPFPPPLGTFGAIISTREPIPNRKALLDIGISGPLCGFLVAIPITIIGFFLMQQNPIIVASTAGQTILNNPLLLQWIGGFFAIPDNAITHPTLFAGWVGIFVTAVNLLPAGQLDGGHVARAFLKDKHKYASWAVIIALIGLSFYYNYTGWIFFAVLILLLIGTQHQPPLDEITPLDTRRKLLGILIVFIFIISFAPVPFS
jgi:membrane-associated protease RseP (regulator of RpoE activity)